ncbi:MaoC family dehydratase [Streptomyces roseirectus]|uniref:MaoC family dehydratase n=1 Tax=Streptomyces roseirectus TaxID=2768066 RepID=A0A7H0IFX7_9ACTN|nr:MaoC family dehydratase [Streptomyces roseirectus]QNP71693.1 MaoC family dehydratase [Streptomyces roseirectus]
MTSPSEGTQLPPLDVEITRTLIVAGAIASRDYQDVHHDPDAARAKGSPDIFMNILTTNGLVGRYLTNHFGPHTRLHKLAIRLGAPNYPGDTMRLTGRVEQVDGTQVTVSITGENSLGRHVTGTAVLSTTPEAYADGDAGAGTDVDAGVGTDGARGVDER